MLTKPIRLFSALLLPLAWTAASHAAALTPGDSWNRHDDYSVAGTLGSTLSVDAPNAGVWVYEFIIAAGTEPLSGTNPWFNASRTSRTLVGINNNAANPAWQQTAFRGPSGRQDSDIYAAISNQTFNAIPAVRWVSPGDGTIEIDGVYGIRNTETNSSINIDYAIVLLDASGAVKGSPLQTGTVATANSGAAQVALDLEVNVLEDESILFAIRPQDLTINSEHFTITNSGGLEDTDRVTITAIETVPIPEPGSLLLIAVGSGLLACRRRR
ncbi:MAG: PEP-CTERM sorting domain-containing protein [Planctomycetota bacterium]